MNLTGKVISYGQDYETGKTNINLVIDEKMSDEISKTLKADKLDITIKEYKDDRSLDANRYYWHLLTELANILETSKTELHNKMLADYGEFLMINDELVPAYFEDTEKMAKCIRQCTENHYVPTSKVITNAKGKLVRVYFTLRGSKTYNTKEMSNLIKGLISECREVGIPESEIMTPFEREKLKEVYGLE